MNDQPSRSPAAAAAPRASRWSLFVASTATAMPAARPAMPIATSARLSPLIQDPAERSARQLALRNKAARAAAFDERPEVRSVVARRQDDRGRGAVRRQALGNVEA